MTREEAISIIRKEYLCVDRDCDIERSCGKCDLMMPSKEPILKAYDMAIKALEQCEVWNGIHGQVIAPKGTFDKIWEDADKEEQEPKTGHCKDCEYFEYDSVAKVDGIPLIVAHEICSKWGDGCKTREDGYCFLFEQKMEG